jgi:hypothetical protein
LNRYLNLIVKPYLTDGSHFVLLFGVGAVIGIIIGNSTVRKLSITDFGSLSEFASSKLTCHICVVESDLSNPGIPVIRIPPATFQYVSAAGSSLTPVPSSNFGGLGNIPLAIAVWGCPGNP